MKDIVIGTRVTASLNQSAWTRTVYLRINGKTGIIREVGTDIFTKQPMFLVKFDDVMDDVDGEPDHWWLLRDDLNPCD